MKKTVKLACEERIANIGIKKILPSRLVSPVTRLGIKYRRIAASMREVGIIEPLVVHPHDKIPDQFMLLDGHIRMDVLRSMGQETVDCLIATDDEAFTYNHKVNRLSPIQEHFMIMKAISSGVSEEVIACTLNVDVVSIRKKRDLLCGICSEAVTIFKGKRATAGALREIRKVRPMRQIEMAELMSASGNFSVPYAKCLVAATPHEHMLESATPKAVDGLSSVDMARMEREMETVSVDFRQIERTHGKNVLNLVITVGYLKGLFDNAPCVRYLAQTYPEILNELQKIIESRSLQDRAENEEPNGSAD